MLFAYNNPKQNFRKKLWKEKECCLQEALSLSVIRGMALTIWLAFMWSKAPVQISRGIWDKKKKKGNILESENKIDCQEGRTFITSYG